MTEYYSVEVVEEPSITEAGRKYYVGSRVSAPVDEVETVKMLKRWVAAGWATDEAGTCGERIPGSRLLNEDGTLGAATKTIQPDDTVTSATATNAE